MSCHMVNICPKFHYNPSTNYGDIAKYVLMDRQTTAGWTNKGGWRNKGGWTDKGGWRDG